MAGHELGARPRGMIGLEQESPRIFKTQLKFSRTTFVALAMKVVLPTFHIANPSQSGLK
jgi:hypothetical protein